MKVRTDFKQTSNSSNLTIEHYITEKRRFTTATIHNYIKQQRASDSNSAKPRQHVRAGAKIRLSVLETTKSFLDQSKMTLTTTAGPSCQEAA